MSPELTVITVCRNAADCISETLTSVAAQSSTQIQYIVVDGASTDGTLDILKACHHIDTLISESDKGIYDAMNKGLARAKGELVYFLNAKDSFFDSHVAAKACSAHRQTGADLLYGDVLITGEQGGSRLASYANLDFTGFFESALCHQGVFGSAKAFAKCGFFDTSYRVAADLDWILRVSRRFRLPAHYLNCTVAIYDGGGISSTAEGTPRTRAEMSRALQTNFTSAELILYRVLRKLKLRSHGSAWRTITKALRWQFTRPTCAVHSQTGIAAPACISESNH